MINLSMPSVHALINRTICGLDNGVWPLGIIRNNAGLLLIGSLTTSFSEIWSKIRKLIGNVHFGLRLNGMNCVLNLKLVSQYLDLNIVKKETYLSNIF